MSSSSFAPISSSTPSRWDVFLSFRGIDTRNGFTSHLHNSLVRSGIRTFIDEPELPSGDVISSELRHAIEQSKIYIVVLSENYASSGWCLEELVEILGWRKSLGRLVLPIFYKIEPSVVRYQIGSFKEAFEKHESRVAMELVKKWRDTLKEVAALSGYHVRDEVPVDDLCIKHTDHAASGHELCENRTEADTINVVVESVLEIRNPGTLEIAKHPVGIDSRVAGIESLLYSGTSAIDGVHWIGIYGMGGVGKTTLATAFYNKMFGSFQGSCFLADIKNICAGPECHVSLQQQLINDVLKPKTSTSTTIKNIKQGINLIRETIGSLKVLVVLDDTDHKDQVDFLVGKFLCRGSVIILTTRQEDLLETLGVKARYMANILDDDESEQLFNHHAFGDTKITEEFRKMSDKILSHAGGLPLAHLIFGSSVKNKLKEGWKVFIDKLQSVPIESEIEEKLKISYNDLGSVHPKLQAFFLDIACSFAGWEVDEAVRILETYYGESVNVYIDILRQRCFITISDDNWNKEMLMHDLLRGMGRKIAGNSRLYAPEDIRDVLQKNEGTEAMEAMIAPEREHWMAHNYRLAREVRKAPEAMTGAQWDSGYQIDAETFIAMPKLRFLRLDFVKMRGNFKKPFKDLRWFSWYGCGSFPSNFRAPELVILELRESRFRSFGEKRMVFQNLKILDLSYSFRLTKTPKFNGLRCPCLKTLKLSHCNSLVKIDNSIGNLERLATVDLTSCQSLESLPDIICKLRALECLYLSYCTSLKALPIDLGNIESLTELKADRLTRISKLPDSLGHLNKLETLDFRGCESLESLPDSICKLRALKTLDISYCRSLRALPIDLGNIESLTELTANGLGRISQLPDSLGQLNKLETLDLRECESLRSLPNSICKLRALKRLDLSYCTSLEGLPMELRNIESLTELWPHELASKSLTEFKANSVKLELQDSTDILEFICNMRSLKFLNIRIRISNKPIIELSNLLFPSTLKELQVHDCMSSLLSLPNLSNLLQLEKIHLSKCSSLTEIQGLEKLISVEELHLDGCISIQGLPNFSSLQNLKSLRLNGCSSLTEIKGLEKLILVEELHLDGFESMQELPNLSNLKNLKSLRLNSFRTLTEIQGLEKLISITELDFRGCKSMKRVPNLSNQQLLKTLVLRNCSSLTEVEGVEKLVSITQLDLSGCTSLKRLPILTNLEQLENINLSNLTVFEGLEKLVSVEELHFDDSKSIQRVPNLSDSQVLKSLQLSGCSSLTEIQGLAELWSIEELHLEGCTSIKVLPNLSNFQELKSLKLKDCSSLVGIPGLEEVISLIELDLGGCTSLKRLPNISNLRLLVKINFPDSSNFNGLRKLFRLFPITADGGSCSDQAVRPPIIHTKEEQRRSRN